MTHADTFTPLHVRLMAQADRMLSALEAIPTPASALEIARLARALCAAERFIRQLHRPIVTPKHPPLRSGGGAEQAKRGKAEGAASTVTPPPSSAASRQNPPPPLRPDGLTGEDVNLLLPAAGGEVSAKLTEGAAKPQTAPAEPWRKGWSDKQAQLREQRAARTGKWPDGTPYVKTG